MKQQKALIVGGSNGIGLAIGKCLMKKGYHLIVVDKEKPLDADFDYITNIEFYKSDLRYFDKDLFLKLSRDLDINVLMITAGIGCVDEFENISASEIDKIMTINTISTFQIIKAFYNRICEKKTFYTGLMVSISGFISSPMMSVYAASKAACMRLIESLNIELEYKNTKNRILNVSPGNIKGTRFDGGENQLELLENLAVNIVEKLLDLEELYIPQYEEVYKGVLDRYYTNPYEFGKSSLQYKKQSGRVREKTTTQIGYLSGTFDLFHVGHLNLLRKAKEQCDYLIVGVHSSGKWKGKETVIPFDERKEIISACKYVDMVVDSCTEDSDAWDLWHYDKLFVGSDYKGTERFKRYEKILSEKGVEIIYFDYTQGISSTQIREVLKEK